MDALTHHIDDPPDEIIPPWESLFPKQIELFNTGIESDCREAHPNCPVAILVEGPRKSSKTIGVCHRVLRHMWETPGARVALIVKTTGSATDGGAWVDLVDIVIPQWLEANFGFEYTTFDRDGNPGAKTDSKTRTIYLRIRNAHGGQSELRLISLQHDHEAKPRLKSSRFSAIWFSELSNFHDANVFRVSWQQLRMYHLKPWQHMWIADTNPSDEGEDSWIYNLWFKRRTEVVRKKEDDDGGSEFLNSLRKLTFGLEDNLVLSKEEIKVMEDLYEGDVGEKSREFYGLWVKGHGNTGKHFADLFSESIHVIGDSDADDIELIPSTETLYSGWDLGSVSNHAACLMEKRLIRDKQNPDKEWPVFCVVDELSYTDEHLTIGQLGLEMMEKILNIEEIHGKQFTWRHYSDDSAVNVWRPSSGTFDYMEIMHATNDRIRLIGVPRPKGSVEARVRLLRRLLRERRIYIAHRCHAVIDMLQNCRKGSTSRDYVEWNKWKHMFDALTYVLFMECQADLETVLFRPSVKVRDLSVPLA